MVSGTTVTSTDLDMTNVTEFDGTVTGKESFTVSPRQVLSLIQGEKGPLTITFTPAPVSITKAKEGEKEPIPEQPPVKLSINGCEYTLPTMNVANFPKAPEFSEPTLIVHGKEFRLLLERTSFCISKDNTRYTLNGSLLKTLKDKVIMAATDGHRLSYAETIVEGVPYATKDPKAINTVLSAKALNWLSKYSNGLISIGVKDGHQTIRTGRSVIVSRVLSGQFPNYEAVMPREASLKLICEIESPKALAKTLARVAKCADDRSGATKWDFGNRTIHAQSSDNGSATAPFEGKMSVNVVGDGGIQIGWNAEYILDFLKVAGDSPFKIGLVDGQTASMFSFDGLKHVIMPIRI